MGALVYLVELRFAQRCATPETSWALTVQDTFAWGRCSWVECGTVAIPAIWRYAEVLYAEVAQAK
jgi:hypothetical protein